MTTADARIIEFLPADPTQGIPATVILRHIDDTSATPTLYRVPVALPPGLDVAKLNIAEYSAIHEIVDPPITPAGVIRIHDRAHLVRTGDPEPVAATKPSHALITGATINSDSSKFSLGGLLTASATGVSMGGAVFGSKGAVTEQVGPAVTRTYGGIMKENPLNFLPSFAFLPLPKYLPSMEIFAEVAGVATQLKNVLAAIKEASKK